MSNLHHLIVVTVQADDDRAVTIDTKSTATMYEDTDSAWKYVQARYEYGRVPLVELTALAALSLRVAMYEHQTRACQIILHTSMLLPTQPQLGTLIPPVPDPTRARVIA